MTRFTTPLEVYRLLPRTNCGECGISTCLAFAAAVLKGEKRPDDCPALDPATRDRLAGNISPQQNMETIREEQLAELKRELAGVDILSRARLLGGRVSGGNLVITCLGKDFSVDARGTVASQCHTHAWFSLPLLDYILHSEGVAPGGRWGPFRELPRGKTWGPLFEQRSEKPLKRIADDHSDLFGDLVSMFRGSSSERAFNSDVAVTLLPLPKVPLLICYWKAEDDMESRLHLFFDDTAERNLPVASLFTLGTGIARMLERIMYTHTDGKSEVS